MPISCVLWGIERAAHAVLGRRFPGRRATEPARKRGAGLSFLGGIGEALGDARLQHAKRGPIDQVKERHLGDAVARLL